jgi:hypothetical protein
MGLENQNQEPEEEKEKEEKKKPQIKIGCNVSRARNWVNHVPTIVIVITIITAMACAIISMTFVNFHIILSS